MASSYPGAVDSFDHPASTDLVSDLPSQLSAGQNAAIVAIETALGVNPQGTDADVVTRLDANDTAVAGKLAKASNLSDVANPATALTNLGGMTKATGDATYGALAGGNAWTGTQDFTGASVSGISGGTGGVTAWAASTAVQGGELRSVDWSGVGTVTYASDSARTTGASFDSTEAGNWTAIAWPAWIVYTTSAPSRPLGVPAGAIGWNGNVDPGSNALDGDPGIGW